MFLTVSCKNSVFYANDVSTQADDYAKLDSLEGGISNPEASLVLRPFKKAMNVPDLCAENQLH